MIERRWADRDDLDGAWKAIRTIADEAIEWAERSPYPEPATLLHGVYEEPS